MTEKTKKLLEEKMKEFAEDEVVDFVGRVQCKGNEFLVYIDNYAMSYILVYEDEDSVKEWSCGMCNDYIYDMEDIADYLNNKKQQS